MGSLFGGCRQLLFPGLLDRFNLLDQTKPRHIPPKLGQRLRWDRFIIGCAQPLTLGRLAQGWLEAADTKSWIDCPSTPAAPWLAFTSVFS